MPGSTFGGLTTLRPGDNGAGMLGAIFSGGGDGAFGGAGVGGGLVGGAGCGFCASAGTAKDANIQAMSICFMVN